MPHMRQRIREATKTALLGTSFAGDDVYVGRVRPLPKGGQDILIYTRSETGRRETNAWPPVQERRCKLLIEIRASTVGEPDDVLSDAQTEVEAKIRALFTLGPPRIMGGLLRQLEYVGCEEVVEAGGERHLGGLQLEYAATYRVTEGSPTEPV